MTQEEINIICVVSNVCTSGIPYLAHVVIWVSLQLNMDAVGQEGTEALAGRTGQLDLNRLVW